MPKGIYQHTKPPWNKGVTGYHTSKKGFKHTKETKERMSLSKLGKKHPHTTVWDRKISEALTGRHLSEDTKRKLSLANPKYYLGKYRDEKTKEKIKLARQHQVLPRKDTSIEIKLQEELTKRGITYQKHYPIIGQPDIAIPDRKIAIFTDGDYWHNRPEVKIRDLKVNEALRSVGWIVLRFTETEINTNIKRVVDAIAERKSFVG